MPRLPAQPEQALGRQPIPNINLPPSLASQSTAFNSRFPTNNNSGTPLASVNTDWSMQSTFPQNDPLSGLCSDTTTWPNYERQIFQGYVLYHCSVIYLLPIC